MILNPCGLIAREAFWQQSESELLAKTNGCGASGWKVDFVPDRLKKVDISLPCNIHDFDYAEGKTEKDKLVADFNLLQNIQKKLFFEINNADDLREAMAEALIYYESVSKFGNSAFWAGKKNKPKSRVDKLFTWLSI